MRGKQAVEQVMYDLLKQKLRVEESFLFAHQEQVQFGFGALLRVEVRRGLGRLVCSDLPLLHLLADQLQAAVPIQQEEKKTAWRLVLPVEDAFSWLSEVSKAVSAVLSPAARLSGYVGSDAYASKLGLNANSLLQPSSFASPDLCFVLPEVELIYRPNGAELLSGEEELVVICRDGRLNEDEVRVLWKTVCEQPEEPDAARASALRNLPVASWEELTRDVRIVPDAQQYQEIVANVQADIERLNLVKVVVARQATGTWAGTPSELFDTMRTLTPTRYEFLWEMPSYQIVGCSPEMLVQVQEKQQVIFRVLAGTSLVGEPMQTDPKQVVEHLTTFLGGVKMVSACCEPASVRVQDVLVIEPAGHIQHFASEIRGTSRWQMTATWSHFLPTLTGTPGREGFEVLTSYEPFSRGVYGGVFGSFNEQEALFCKIIRSVYLESDQFYAYSGAGIIPESRPEDELIETHNKMRGALSALAALRAQKRSETNGIEQTNHD